MSDINTDNAASIDVNKQDILECPVCLQSCIQPVRLPCGHIFCFLCIKGTAVLSKRCAMCRKDIPVQFLRNPQLLSDAEDKTAEAESRYIWYYQGRNGWWQYDERTSCDLEEAHNAGTKTIELLIAGFLYTIDLDEMVQKRRNDPSRSRKIKRDIADIPDKKGVAGIRAEKRHQPNNTSNVTVMDCQSAVVSSSTGASLPVRIQPDCGSASAVSDIVAVGNSSDLGVGANCVVSTDTSLQPDRISQQVRSLSLTNESQFSVNSRPSRNLRSRLLYDDEFYSGSSEEEEIV